MYDFICPMRGWNRIPSDQKQTLSELGTQFCKIRERRSIWRTIKIF